jgi:hypothetical protein
LHHETPSLRHTPPTRSASARATPASRANRAARRARLLRRRPASGLTPALTRAPGLASAHPCLAPQPTRLGRAHPRSSCSAASSSHCTRLDPLHSAAASASHRVPARMLDPAEPHAAQVPARTRPGAPGPASPMPAWSRLLPRLRARHADARRPELLRTALFCCGRPLLPGHHLPEPRTPGPAAPCARLGPPLPVPAPPEAALHAARQSQRRRELQPPARAWLLRPPPWAHLPAAWVPACAARGPPPGHPAPAERLVEERKGREAGEKVLRDVSLMERGRGKTNWTELLPWGRR